MEEQAVHKDPAIQGGVPVFTGTRVPVKNLFDYLVSARKPLYRSFPVTIHHTFRASCSPISSRKMPAIGLGGVIGGGPAPIFGTRP